MRGNKVVFWAGAASIVLFVSSCGIVEDQLTGGADSTTTVLAPETTTEAVPVTEAAASGFESEGDGLNAAELRLLLENMAESEAPVSQMERFGFVPAVKVPEGGELEGFEMEFAEGFSPGDVRYSTTAVYRYPVATSKFKELVKFIDQAGDTNGWTESSKNDLETLSSRRFDLDEPVENGEVKLLVQDLSYREVFIVEVEYRNFKAQGPELIDQQKYSSWFDGVAPIPSGASFVGGGAGWVSEGAGLVGVFLEEGQTLTALFKYSDKESLELKDEARKLGEALDMTATEENGSLILENSDVRVSYELTPQDELSVAANFR